MGVRRRLVAAIGGLGLLAGVAACGGGDEPEGASGKLTLWQYYGDPSSPTGKPLYDLVKKYDDARPDVTVDVRFIPYDDFNRTLLQSAAAKELPDVALIGAFDTATMASAGIVQDLGERVGEWGQQDKYFKTSWATTQVEGKTYGIPHVADAYAVYYNKQLLQQAGVQPPTTWAEMETAAKKLTAQGRTGLAISGIEGPEGATVPIIRMLAAGASIDKVDSAEGRAGLDQLARMIKAGSISKGALTWNEEDAKNQFANGKAAMMINSATYVNILRKENPKLQWDVALLPKDRTGQTFLSAENLAIGATSTNPDGAWDLITWLQQPAELQSYLPVRNKLAARNDVPDSSNDPVRKVFAQQLEEAWAPDEKLAPKASEVMTHLQAALQASASGSASTEDALKAAQKAIDDSLAK
ncbi:extracellular solute-binding protein family 1 [Kribbella flavida DSM 17836]|uniref:Extracellular solute-binding protein family 1 n=1 Tax=Kribbella flavida (strain DSM 17836 / JCM 10339 / NBRC 14399) TaxID=479435 RepID=D2PRS1_KRIFD|nr:sugar ABC transporter substrate-binding protein [Kribbella flavida]ADB29251.1 extracellular solute-binding protein family 1 [Kribbella flavida DSM 17836]